MFVLENRETRKSLRNVFSRIFEKYERNFQEDDEIDLESMKVTQSAGHLARLKRLQFGSIFKHRRVRGPKFSLQGSSIVGEDDLVIAEEESYLGRSIPIVRDDIDIFETLNLRKEDVQMEKERELRVAEKQSSFKSLIASSSSTVTSMQPNNTGFTPTFNIQGRSKSRPRSNSFQDITDWLLLDPHMMKSTNSIRCTKHSNSHDSKCFDCSLFRLACQTESLFTK